MIANQPCCSGVSWTFSGAGIKGIGVIGGILLLGRLMGQVVVVVVGKVAGCGGGGGGSELYTGLGHGICCLGIMRKCCERTTCVCVCVFASTCVYHLLTPDYLRYA